MSHVWMSHVTHMNESCRTSEGVMSHITQSHSANDTYLSYDIWQVICHRLWHDLFICVTWLIHMCDMSRSYVWHDSFICVTWLIHMSDMTHSYLGQKCIHMQKCICKNALQKPHEKLLTARRCPCKNRSLFERIGLFLTCLTYMYDMY